MNCITYYNNTNDDVYIGTDVGVYYRNASMTSWIPFMTGLPNVIVNDIDIFYPTGKIRAGTYGRGVWQSDKYSNSVLDAAIVNVLSPINGSSGCNNTVVPKITITNLGSTTISTLTILYKMDAAATQTLNWNGSLATSSNSVVTLNTFSGLSNAVHTFSVWTTNPNLGIDQDLSNNNTTATFTISAAPLGNALPLIEGFESTTFPPANWLLEKANTIDAAVSWTRVLNATGLTAGSTAVARMDNYSSSLDISGQLDALRTPALSFAGAGSSLSLSFDVSHKNYSTTDIDSLNVKISTDCGNTWIPLYSKGGAQLANSVGTQSTTYVPVTNAEWRRETISLASYAGLSSVYLKFESRSGWGNHLYLDNVNISSPVAAVPVSSFSSPLTKCVASTFTLTDLSTNSPSSWSWSIPGGNPSTSTLQNPAVTFTNSGTYTVTLISANSTGTSTPVSQTITINNNPTVSANNATICSGSNAIITASGATTYSWNTGANTVSITVSPTVTTNYSVFGTNSLGCKNTKTVSVSVNPKPTVSANSTTICAGTNANITASGASTYSWNTGANTASISVSPTVTTNYSVVGTNSLGCVNTKTVSVLVNPKPNVLANSATICVGSSTAILASGASTYTWNTGVISSSISVSPTITTNYSVVGTNSLGCVNTKTLTVVVNSLPTVVMSAVAGPLCVNDGTIGLSGTPSGGIFSGVGVSGANFSPSISGAGTFTLTYSYTNSNGCSNSNNKTVLVSLCTSVDELNSSFVTVFPNPVKDILNISSEMSFIDKANIELFDAQGKLVLTEAIQSELTVIDMSSFASGIYTLRIVTNESQLLKRIIKE